MSDLEDKIETIGTEIEDRLRTVADAEDNDDPVKAGEAYEEIADLVADGLELLKQGGASADRISDWQEFRTESQQYGCELIADGESQVDPDPFKLDVLASNVADTAEEDSPTSKTSEESGAPDTSDTTTDERPFWEPTVSIVGLGSTGKETVRRIETETPARTHTSPEPSDLEKTDFLFVSGNLSEPGVQAHVTKLLSAAEDACTVFFAEGRTENPDTFVDDVNLLFPLSVTGSGGRQLVASTIADLCECMLQPTLHELGKGDILVVAGDERVGQLFIDDPENAAELADLTPGIRTASPDAQVIFCCYDGPYPLKAAITKIDQYDAPDVAAYLWDPRTHSRYEDRVHIKRLLTTNTTREKRVEILQADRTE